MTVGIFEQKKRRPEGRRRFFRSVIRFACLGDRPTAAPCAA